MSTKQPNIPPDVALYLGRAAVLAAILERQMCSNNPADIDATDYSDLLEKTSLFVVSIYCLSSSVLFRLTTISRKRPGSPLTRSKPRTQSLLQWPRS